MQKEIDNIPIIDLSTDRISTAICQINQNNEITITKPKTNNKLKIYNAETNTINISILKKEISNILDIIENSIEEKLKSISITTNLLNANSIILKSKINTNNKLITNYHLNQCMDYIYKEIYNNKNSNKEILQTFPIKYEIETGHTDNPIGYKSSFLTTKYNVVMCNKDILSAIKSIFEKSEKIQIKSIIPNSYASGLSCLTENDKNEIILLINMTDCIASIGLFHNNIFLKTITINTQSNSNNTADIKIKALNDLHKIRQNIQSNILLITNKIIITGDIALIDNIKETTEEIFNKPCEIRYPSYPNFKNPKASSLVGAIIQTKKQIINDKNYFNVSKSKISIKSIFKNIIDEI